MPEKKNIVDMDYEKSICTLGVIFYLQKDYVKLNVSQTQFLDRNVNKVAKLVAQLKGKHQGSTGIFNVKNIDF